MKEALTATENISILLKPRNFHIKGWIISGDQKPIVNIYDKDLQKVLGVSWKPSLDTIQFEIRLNFSKKVKNQRMGPDLAEMNIPADIPNSLTKRIVMSQLNGIYDPLSLLTPFTIKGKILMRNLWAKQYDWDTVLCPIEAEKWIDFLQEMLQVKLLKFPRSIKPTNTSKKKSILIILSDASKDAFGCCCYARWELTDGKFVSNLLTAKW